MIQLPIQRLFDLRQVAPQCHDEKIDFTGISIDSRHLQPGNLFIALRGEKLDGHNYVEIAFQKGAAAALVEHSTASAIPQFLVKDTKIALGQLGAYWRQQFPIPIIGITGSNGKTTLKNMLARILQCATNEPNTVLATKGNLNNEYGLPLTLAQLNAKHRYAVIEMGMNHAGEIAYLTKLTQPQVAVITNAAEAHLEGLKTVAGIAQAKGEIFLGLPPNGTAILNRDDAFFETWATLTRGRSYLTFGLKNTADVSAIIGNTVTIQTPQGCFNIKLPLLGTHNLMNALAATASALALNIEISAIQRGLESVTPEPGRMQQFHLDNDIRIIDDTYNANPVSLKAAVQTLATLPGTKIIVLGDMKELGPDALHYHKQAGENIRDHGIHYLFTYGDLSLATAQAFGKNAQHFSERESLLNTLKPYLQKDVVLLVKGSRSMRMEYFIKALVPQTEYLPTH